MTNKVLECPIDDFLSHYVPFSPSQQSITKAFNDLHKDPRQLLKKIGRGTNRVWALTELITSPSACEATTLNNFENIMDVLQYAEGDGNRRNCRFFYKNCPSSDTSQVESTNFRVDACITGNVDAKEVALFDVAAIVEFKRLRSSNGVKDNCSKLFLAANQIMNVDPRRTWVYGITIEGKQMTAWYFCRSHSVKSVPFNFTTDVKKLISVFLSLLYATEPEIGYDPTVRRVTYNNEFCYVYEVGTQEAPRYYRTTKLLFTASTSCITGRATRVWKVVEMEHLGDGRFGRDIGDEVVLKDGWVDEDSRSEQEIQAAIFERLDKIEPSDYQWAPRYLRERLDDTFQNNKYKEYFMEISDSRRIGKTMPRVKTAKLVPHLLSSPDRKRTNLLHVVDDSMQSEDRSGMLNNVSRPFSGNEEEVSRNREYKTKEQHRLIYRHVGCALTNAKDLATSFTAIHDTFISLVLLYLAGWTHRDISAGNIIVFEENGSIKGKLSDLEYAEEFTNTNPSTGSKTGTPYFMPFEIHSSRPLYIPSRVLPSDTEDDPFASSPPQAAPPTNRRRGRTTHPPKFRFQHDLESLWWVMLWILLYRVGGTKALQLVERIFTYSDSPSQARADLSTGEYDGLVEYIHDKLQFLTPRPPNIRDILLNSYLSKQKTENFPVRAECAEIYEKVWIQLTKLIGAIPNIEGVGFQNPAPEPEATEEKTKKRPRSKSGTSNDDEYKADGDDGEQENVTSRSFGPRKSRRTVETPE